MDRLAGSVLQYRQDCRRVFRLLAGVFIKHFGVTTAWMVIMLIIAVIMCALGLYHIFILPATSNATSAEDKNLGEALRELWNVFADFFKKKHIV